MVLILIVTIPTIVCLLFACADIIRDEVSWETRLLLVFGFVGVIVAGAMIGHDFALWSLT